jgi:hypothetical protein
VGGQAAEGRLVGNRLLDLEIPSHRSPQLIRAKLAVVGRQNHATKRPFNRPLKGLPFELREELLAESGKDGFVLRLAAG